MFIIYKRLVSFKDKLSFSFNFFFKCHDRFQCGLFITKESILFSLHSNFLEEIVHRGFPMPAPGFVEAPCIFDTSENCSSWSAIRSRITSIRSQKRLSHGTIGAFINLLEHLKIFIVPTKILELSIQFL